MLLSHPKKSFQSLHILHIQLVSQTTNHHPFIHPHYVNHSIVCRSIKKMTTMLRKMTTMTMKTTTKSKAASWPLRWPTQMEGGINSCMFISLELACFMFFWICVQHEKCRMALRDIFLLFKRSPPLASLLLYTLLKYLGILAIW